MPRHEDAPDSAREGDRHRVHQKRRLQVPLSLSLSISLVMVIAFGIDGLRDKIWVFKGIVIDFDGKSSVICVYVCV